MFCLLVLAEMLSKKLKKLKKKRWGGKPVSSTAIFMNMQYYRTFSYRTTKKQWN